MAELDYKGVWVFIEQKNGAAAAVGWELLGAGADLAKTLDVELSAVVIGDKVEHLCQEAFIYGAAKAYLMDDPVFHYYRTEPYYKSVCQLINKYKPEIVLLGSTGIGRDLSGAVATGLKTGLTEGCTKLEIGENRLLLMTRPAYSGNIMATIIAPHARPQIATVRPRAMPMPGKDTTRQGEIIREPATIQEESIGVKVLEVIDSSKEGSGTVNLTNAEIIICGGRGVQAKENFQLLQDLADAMGGKVACTRAAVEDEIAPLNFWVGQSGVTVRPKVYIACGVSGAIQHLAGMRDSGVIVAINYDRQAPIYEVSTYGIEGDCLQVIPAMTEYVKELRAKKAN